MNVEEAFSVHVLEFRTENHKATSRCALENPVAREVIPTILPGKVDDEIE